MLLRILYSLLFITLFNAVIAKDIIELKSGIKNNFKNKIYYFEDTMSTYQIHDIISKKINFRVSKEEIPNFPTSLSSYWIYFKVVKSDTNDYFIEIGKPQIDILNIYAVDEQNNILFSIESGTSKAFTERLIKRSNFIFPLKLPLGKEVKVFIKYKDIGGLELPIQILPSYALLNEYTLSDMFYGLYYGILLLSILYNFFLFITIKDYSYIYYVISIFFFGLFQFILNGHIHYILPSIPNWFTSQFLLLVGNLFMISALIFVRYFIHTKTQKTYLTKISRILKILCLISITLLLVQPLLPNYIMLYNQTLLSCIAIIFPIYMITVGISATLSGYKPAKFFLMAWAVFLLGIFLFVLYSNGIIPNNFINQNMMTIGSALEATLLSFALGHRYTILKEEKENTQAELNRKLEVSNEKLVKINSDLDNFVYTASHDLKAPISNLEGLVNHLKGYGTDSNEELGPIINMMSTSIVRLRNTIEDLTEISKVNQNLEVDVHINNIPDVMEEINHLLKNQMEESGTKIIMNQDSLNAIRFSKKNFRSILYNLINNAIKYRSQDRIPQITIHTELRSNYVLMSVADNGIGISEQNKSKVFEMFRRAHHHVEGTGIGLYLVKRMVENEGGKIELESSEGKGSTFKVYFKIDYK